MKQIFNLNPMKELRVYVYYIEIQLLAKIINPRSIVRTLNKNNLLIKNSRFILILNNLHGVALRIYSELEK
ncbi:hypothetical protein FACS189456_0540 [Bacteroidia bacterium]|nr:hypothetical protein FACS189456_0540 [Bacteroidia bacterium]